MMGAAYDVGDHRRGRPVIRNHRDQEVWQKVSELAAEHRRLVRRLPAQPRQGLRAQMPRAAVPISSNIAEGRRSWKRRRGADHVTIALGALAEIEALMLLAHRLEYLAHDDAATFWLLAHRVGRLLSALRRSLDHPPAGQH